MKFFMPTIVSVIAFLSATVNANGVCYDPDHTSGKSASTVAADMQTIAGAGFDSVRTYISKFGDVEMGPIITGAGLTAVLGVPYPQGDYQEQMAAAIKAAQGGGVYAIMVGNENLAGNCNPPSDMISVIQSIKSQVPQGVYVGSVQRNTEGIECQGQYGWEQLIAACDKIGINAHPFFNPGTTADGAIDVVNTQWQTMSSAYGSKLLLTETGWPSSGSVSGNTGSLEGAQKYYNAYQQWSSSQDKKFYFQMFDTPGKAELYEQTFGLYTADSQSKFTVSNTPSTSNQQQQQQQQQQQTAPAPAPSTAAPTPEPTPAPTPEPTPVPTNAPVATTAAPTEAPEQYQNTTSTSGSTTSTSGSNEQQQQGSASFPGSNPEVGSNGSSVGQESKADSKTEQTTQSTAETSSIGKSSETQQQQQQQTSTSSQANNDSTQNINTQSAESSGSSTAMFAVGGGACAVLVAFGFIYQARKRAEELDNIDDKDDRFSVITPVENICSL